MTSQLKGSLEGMSAWRIFMASNGEHGGGTCMVSGMDQEDYQRRCYRLGRIIHVICRRTAQNSEARNGWTPAGQARHSSASEVSPELSIWATSRCTWRSRAQALTVEGPKPSAAHRDRCMGRLDTPCDREILTPVHITDLPRDTATLPSRAHYRLPSPCSTTVFSATAYTHRTILIHHTATN